MVDVFIQEIDPVMRAGLSERLPGDCHIFGDVMDVFGGGDMLSQFLSIESYKGKLEFASTLPLHSTSYCHRHGQRCPINTGAAARMGGLPCQDYSAAGLQKQVSGVNYPCTLGFSYKCSLANTSIIGIECVPRLPREVPVDAFRHDTVTWLLDEVLEPGDLGFENIASPRLLACKGEGYSFSQMARSSQASRSAFEIVVHVLQNVPFMCCAACYAHLTTESMLPSSSKLCGATGSREMPF